MLKWSKETDPIAKSWHKNMPINKLLSQNYEIELRICYELRAFGGKFGSAGSSFGQLAELYVYDRITKFQLEQLNLKSYSLIRVLDFNQSRYFQVLREKLSSLICKSLFTTIEKKKKKEMERIGQHMHKMRVGTKDSERERGRERGNHWLSGWSDGKRFI